MRVVAPQLEQRGRPRSTMVVCSKYHPPAMACRARVRAHLIVRTNGHATRGCYAMPLQAGILRLTSRNERRPGLPPEPWLPFYARQGVEAVRKAVTFVKRWHKLATLRRRIAREDPCRNYTDFALTANGLEDLRLYTQTAEARAAVTRERLVAGLPV